MDSQNDAALSAVANVDKTLPFPCSVIVGYAIVMASVAGVGILLNSFLILVTVKTKQLHGTANALLALNSLFELLHEYGHFNFLSVAISDHCLITYKNSFRALAFSLFGLFASTFLMLFTGIDRLFCVLLPLNFRYFRFGNCWPYLGSALSLVAIPCIALLCLFWQRSEEVPSLNVCGSIGDLILQGGFAYTAYSNVKLACTSSTIIIYGVVAVFLRFKRHQLQMASNHRIFYSLLIIVLFNVGGYFLIAIFYEFCPSPEGHEFWKIRMILSILANLSGVSNAPILFMTSTEYRKAFKKQYQIFSLLLSRNRNTVQPVTFVLQQAPPNHRQQIGGQQQNWGVRR